MYDAWAAFIIHPPPPPLLPSLPPPLISRQPSWLCMRARACLCTRMFACMYVRVYAGPSSSLQTTPEVPVLSEVQSGVLHLLGLISGVRRGAKGIPISSLDLVVEIYRLPARRLSLSESCLSSQVQARWPALGRRAFTCMCMVCVVCVCGVCQCVMSPTTEDELWRRRRRRKVFKFSKLRLTQ